MLKLINFTINNYLFHTYHVGSRTKCWYCLHWFFPFQKIILPRLKISPYLKSISWVYTSFSIFVSYLSFFHRLLTFLKKILVTCSLLSPLPKLLLTSEILCELIQHYLRDAVLFQSTMFSVIFILLLNLNCFCICPLFSIFVSNHSSLSFIPSFIILSIKSNHFDPPCQCLLHSMQDSLNSLNFVFFSLFLLASLNPWIISNICINFYFWDAIIIDKNNETDILAIPNLLSESACYGHGMLRIWHNK